MKKGRMTRAWTAVWLVLIMTLGLAAVAVAQEDSTAAEPPHAVFEIGDDSYTVDGGKYDMDAPAFIREGRTFVPVRFMARAIGVPEGNIVWVQARHEVQLQMDSVMVQLRVGEPRLWRNGAPVEMDVAPLNLNGRVYLPVRYLAEAFDHQVVYDALRQQVRIMENDRTRERERLRDQTGDGVPDQTREQLRDQTQEQLRDQTQDQLQEQDREQLRDQERLQG